MVCGSVRQLKASKSEVPCSTPDSCCFYLVIKNYINDRSKHKKTKCYYLFCIVLTVIYNMYKSMTS